MPTTDVRAVLLWMGGVLTKPVPEQAVDVILGQPIESLDVEPRMQLRQVAQDLYLGRTNGRAYCETAIQACHAGGAAEEVERGILERTSLRPGLLELLDGLPPRYKLWLISDYPPEWFGPISSRLGIAALFPEGNILITATAGLARLVPDIFNHMVYRSGHPLEECLMVDGDSARAVMAVRHGLTATIFTSAARLAKDFRLRKMLP